MENKIFLFIPKKNISHDLFWKCQCINIALMRALKPRVGIILLSFGAFLGNLGFNQAEHGPFSETRGVSGAVCCVSIMACCSQSGRPCSLYGKLAEPRTAVN